MTASDEAAERLRAALAGYETVDGVEPGWLRPDDVRVILSERQRFMKALEQVKALCGFDSPVMDAWDAARKWLKDNGDTGASMPRDIMEGGISAFYEVADEALSPTPGPRP